VIEGFDQAVTGMQVGETRTVHIPSDQAYGPYRQDLVFDVEKELLPEGTQVGQTLEMTQADGSKLYVTVTEIGESTATLDANHSLAGKDLNFEIELVEIG
jgi:peptidylprolyl isomerase